MGFLSKIRNRVKKQIQPSIGSIRTPDNFVAPPPPMDLDRIMRGPGLNPRDMGMKSDGSRFAKFDVNSDNFPRGRVPRSSCPALNEEVLLADNKWIPAQDLKVGDKVATHLGSNKVTHIDVLKDRVKKEVVFSDNDQEESIVTSDSHPYYVQNEEGFVEVKDLKVGDQVGNFKVKEIKDADKGSVVHISIDQAQTYYLKAGDKKVLSHNKRPPSPGSRPIGDMRFRGEMPRGGGFGFGLGEAIRRLNQQGGMMPQPIPRAEIDISALESLPMGDIPMTQDLPEVAPIGMMPQMDRGRMQPRMMMQAGEDVSLERELFSLQSQLENLKEQLRLDRSYNDDQAVINTSAEMAAIQKRMQEILSDRNLREIMGEKGRTIANSFMDMESGRTISDIDRGRTMSDLDSQMGRTISDLDRGRTISDMDRQIGMMYGGEMKGYANGGEIENMLSGMGSGEQEAMGELEQMAPEMEMIDQLVNMVVQMIQQGASEEEVIMFLREQGLDDEDIGTVLQLVAEMAEAEAMPQDGIGAELEQLV